MLFRALVGAVLLCAAGWLEAARGAQVELFSPQGVVRGVRQATARFSEPMVALGDPRAGGGPFAIECGEPGTGRWVDSRTWAYDFARDLPAGLRCAFRLRADLTSLRGDAISGQQAFEFSTGGPAILMSVPSDGSEDIEEEQAFVLQLDALPTEASLAAHVWFRVDGLRERVGVRPLTGPERDTILQTLSYLSPRESLLVLQARQRFPNGAKVGLVWGREVSTASGIANEQDQVLEFATRAAFAAQYSCERSHLKADCLPITPVRLSFSSPVRWDLARGALLVGPDGKRWQPPVPDDNDDFVESIEFRGPFPEASSLQLTLPADLRDDAGRPLANASGFPLTIQMAEYPPLAKFASRFGIVEVNAEPVLPVTLRNLEPEVAAQLLQSTTPPQTGLVAAVENLTERLIGSVRRIPPERPEDVLPWLRRVGEARRITSVFAGVPAAEGVPKTFTLPKPNGAKAFEVIGIPLAGPGLYIMELASPRLGAALLGEPGQMFVPTAALVTNLAVHFKWGRDRSLAWVTTLDGARPVWGAEVTVQDCNGDVLWGGRTDGQGVARIDGLLARERLPYCSRAIRADDDEESEWSYDDSSQTRALDALYGGLLITARVGGDFSFVHSGWSNGIESWRFQLPTQDSRGPLVAHTILDRSLFRAGETVHMKHLLRRQTMDGFDAVAAATSPDVAVLEHLGSDEKFALPLSWDAAGSAESQWPIPPAAKLGAYQIVLRPTGDDTWAARRVSGTFRVEEFRVPLMRALVRLPSEPQVGASDVPLDVSVQYLAGGAAAQLPVAVRAVIRPKSFTPSWELERFVFANGPVKEGVVRSGESAPAGDANRPVVHQRADLVLDGAGGGRTTITGIPPAPTLRELLAEAELRDPNGEVQTVAATLPLWPAEWLIGIRTEDWASSREQLETRLAVVDRSGKPVAAAPVKVQIHRRRLYSHRKRLVGGFYAYEHVEEIGPALAVLCEGRTDASGQLRCAGAPPADGNLILQGSVTDGAGKVAVAHDDVWVPGQHEWRFDVDDSDRIDLLPEKSRYEPGETARFQVRMPFRAATALVTVEREGVQDVAVVDLAAGEPVVEVPIQGSYAPNVFVSALVVRGRVGDVQPTALLDLGKPAFKLGVAEIAIGWRAHELAVSVAAERETYRVRERATVRIAVHAADGTPLPAGAEVAVAAVDEGLLELQPNTTWNVLPLMMGRRGYGVQTATAQMQVVGKRHFGLKALPQGGGGGRQGTRELFDTLLLWHGRVALDANGEATVEVPLNDALTSFRIVAVATAGSGRFGTGATTIRSTQDLMVLSGVAPLVRAGDRIRSEFTVRNASERAMNANVTARVEGLRTASPPQTVALAAGEAKVIDWALDVPAGVERLAYEVEARERDGARDQLRVSQVVRPLVPVRTLQADLLQLKEGGAGSKALPAITVRPPRDAVPGLGGLRLTFSPSLTGGLAGVRDWMARYPYDCLEQRVSRAVVLRDAARWNAIVAALPSYQDGDGLLKYFPTMTSGSDVLTAYVLAVTQAAGLQLPAAVQAKMQQGLRGFVAGSIRRDSAVAAADLSLRKLAALAALARVGSVEPALLGGLTIEPNLWPTSAVLDWWSLLERAPNVPDRDRRRTEAERIIRARLNLQGTTMGFSTESNDTLWWLMICPDTNAQRLALHLVETGSWKDDVARVLRGALARQRQGHWDCTLSNAWGALAVERFAERFEAEPVGGITTSTLAADGDRQTERVAWETVLSDQMTIDMAWPPATGSLSLQHEGTGAPWVTIQSRAAIPLTAPLSSGYQIRKTVTPEEPRAGGHLSRGDVLRVRLEIDAQSDMTWVVVNDPIPAGASHLGTGLARDSQIAAGGESAEARLAPAFVERAFEAFRAYYDWVPKGAFVVEYTIRLNQTGILGLPPTRVEALYAPEMFGELPNAPFEVRP